MEGRHCFCGDISKKAIPHYKIKCCLILVMNYVRVYNQTVPFSVQVPHLEGSWPFEEKHWFDRPIFSFALVAATAV